MIEVTDEMVERFYEAYVRNDWPVFSSVAPRIRAGLEAALQGAYAPEAQPPYFSIFVAPDGTLKVDLRKGLGMPLCYGNEYVSDRRQDPIRSHPDYYSDRRKVFPFIQIGMYWDVSGDPMTFKPDRRTRNNSDATRHKPRREAP